MLIKDAHGQYVRLTRMIEEATDIAIIVGIDAVPIVQVKVVAIVGATIRLGRRKYFPRVAGHKCPLGHIGQCTDAPTLGRLLAFDNLQRSPCAVLHHTILAGQLKLQQKEDDFIRANTTKILSALALPDCSHRHRCTQRSPPDHRN